MFLRIVLLSLVAGPAIIEALNLNVPVVCPCTYVVNRSIKVAKHVLKDKDKDNNNGNCNCDGSLPPQQPRETYVSFIRRVFARQDKEPVETYCARIYKQYKDESDEKYLERVDNIHSTISSCPCKDNTEFWRFNERYYTLKYGKLDSIIPLLRESPDQHYARILRREKNEDFNAFIHRLDCVFKAYPKLDIWRRIRFDSDSRNWYFYRHSAYNCAIRPSENIRESVAIQYARRECENGDDYSYYKRIMTKQQGESDADYLDRVCRIQARFGDLPLWNNCEYVDLTKRYYQLLYAKKENEKCEDYYKRIMTKSTTEDFPVYVKRMEILQRCLSNLPLWNSSKHLKFTAPFYSRLFAKKPGESDETYMKRISARNPSETLEVYLNRMNICRWVNKGNGLFYDKKYLPYVKNYYECYFKKGKEGVEDWLAKIFNKDYEECDEDYVRKCNFLTTVVSVVDTISKIDLAEFSMNIMKDYYRLYFKKQPNETKEEWMKRVTTQFPYETVETFRTRLQYLENVYTDCRKVVGGVLKRLVGSEKSCSKEAEKEVEVLLVKKKETLKKAVSKEKTTKKTETIKKPEKKTIEEEIEEMYGRRNGEDDMRWFKRITMKSPGETKEQYLKTMNMVRKYFPSLPVWYNKQYRDLVKEYYTCLYARGPSESDDAYYSRIVTPDTWETPELASQRVALLMDLYPTLKLWNNEDYFKYTKKIYEAGYKKRPTESDEQWVERILAKDSLVDTTTQLWASRVHLVYRATASCPVWSSEEYYKYTKEFFATWFKKGDSEDCTSWLTRVLKRPEGELEENALKRVRLIKQTTGDCGCWTEFTFKKVAGSKCLSKEYLDDIENEFFDSISSYETIYSSSRAQAVASAGSASASAEASAQEVKTAA